MSIVFILGLLLRLLYLYQFSSSPLFQNIVGPDVEEYNNWADAILQGNFIWKSVSIHSPLYAYYLALLKLITGNNFFLIRFIQLFAGMISFFVLFNAIYSIKIDSNANTNEVKINKIAAYCFLCISIFFIPLFFYQAEIISEALLIPLICLSIAFLYEAEKKKSLVYYIFSGLLLGLSIITHPISLFFAFAEIGYLILKYLFEIIKSGFELPFDVSFFALPIIIIIIGISVYNSILQGKIVFIQKNSGYNLYLGNNAKANGMCNISAGPEWVNIHRKADIEALNLGISKDEYFYREVYKYITEEPVKWLELIGLKCTLVWNYKDIYSSLDPVSVKYFTALMKNFRYLFGIISVFALFGFILTLCDFRKIYTYRHFLILLVSIWGGLTITVVSDRYRYLLLPTFFIFAPAGLIYFYCNLKSLKRTVFCIFIFSLCAVIVYLPLYKIDYKKDLAFAYSMYGEAFYKAGEYEKAKYSLFKALKRFPKWSRCYIDLGIMEMDKNPSKAIKLFKIANKLLPGDSTPLLNIGLTYVQMGNNSKALIYFKKAFENNPDNNEVIYNYGYSLYFSNKFDEALKVLSYGEEKKCNDSRIRNLIGVIYLKKNNPQKALPFLESALFYKPESLEYMLNLAVCYVALHNYRRSNELIDEVLQKNPENNLALTLKKQLKGF